MLTLTSFFKKFRRFFRKNPAFVVGGISLLLTLSLVIGGVSADPSARNAKAYSDVAADSSPASAIDEAAALGLLRGYENGLFGPNDPVTRAQIAIILQRLRNRDLATIRAQLAEVRSALSLGTCGDSIVQTGEECDDGNDVSRDGCSKECLLEVLQVCLDGHRIGEEYPSDDGCNTCICTQNGATCTKMKCSAPEEELPPQDVEPENTEPLAASVMMAAPICGNRVCEYEENTLPPHPRFYCPQDCTGEVYEPQCETLTEEFRTLVGVADTCQSDDDCTKLEQSCAFLTCGEAVNKVSYPALAMKQEALFRACQTEGAVQGCLTCPQSAALCRQGQCVLVEESQ